MNHHTEETLEQNYNKFIGALKKSFTGERLEKLLHMYSMEELGPNLMLSPASGNKNYHNAYEGGYIDHIMNVVKNSLRMQKLYIEAGGLVDYEQEELLFAAFHHDLGKLGEKGNMNYVPNTSDWHIKNRGEVYKRNSDLSYLTATDRTFLLLNNYGVKFTENEYFGIKLTDGMYDEDNVKYFKVFDTSKYLKTNIQYILHWADHMSTTIERDVVLKPPF
tara:strand:- start:2199 stop:2855 length:657 start_codon:yes stop_codon:yes gene_type:complete